MTWRFVFLLFLCSPVFSQKNHSELKTALSLAERSGNQDSISYYLAQLSSRYLIETSYDSAEYFLKKGLAFNTYAGNKIRLAEILNNLGVWHFQAGTLDSSIYYYDRAYKVYQQVQDTSMMHVLEINLGLLYKQKGLYEKSLEFLLRASHQLEKTTSSTNLATCYNAIGNVYSKIGEAASSLEYHYKALNVRKKLQNKVAISSSYNNIGNVYLTLNQLDSALMNFQNALKLKREINDVAGEAICLNNMGELMIKKGSLGEAEVLLQSALSIRIDIKDRIGELSTRTNLANLYMLQGDLSRSGRELRVAEEMAYTLGLLDQLKEIYGLQIKLNEKSGDLDKALEYSQRLLVVKDSLLNREKAQSLAEMQTRYESLKKEDRIALLEKEGLLQAVELERRQIWIKMMGVAIGLILIIVVLVYHNFRTVRKNKVHIELLLRELHHRVKNNLQILSSLLSLQSQQLTDDTAIKAVKSSESRINAMALIHRKLYTVDQNRTVDIKEYITELIQYLVYSYGYHEKNFKLDLEIKEISIDVDKAIPLGLILNELISNAFKHAYENHPSPRLVVNLAYPDSHELNISIQDNGAGMPDVDEKQRKTFGMKIVSTLIKELKGSLNVKTDNGTTYDLHIPI